MLTATMSTNNKLIFIFTFFLLAIATIKSENSSNQTDSFKNATLYLNKEIRCCKSGTTYLPGLDQCVPNFVSTLYTNWFPDYSFPTDGLTDCLDGYVSHSTKDFHFANGTLLIGDKWLESNDFCINRVEEEHPTSNGSFVARYCVPDPCKRLGRLGCIRKCCPSGMAMVTKYYHDLPITICESHQEPLNLSILRNPKNETIDQGSFFTHGGLGMKCRDLSWDRYGISSFSIDHDGQIWINTEDHPNQRKLDGYCIDNLVKDGTIDVVALGCVFPENVLLKFALALKLISTSFLIATLAVYCLLPKLRNIHGVTVMCFLASMAIQYISYVILDLVRLQVNDMPKGLCHTIAISLRFAQSANLSWLNVMFFGVWRMFYCLTRPSAPTNTTVLGKKFFYYSVYGWGVPLIIVAVGQILQHNDVLDDLISPALPPKLHCTFSYKQIGSLIAYLYGPIISMIGANVFMFVWASFNFYRASTESSHVTNVPRKGQRFKVIVRLFLLMGVQWLADMIFFFMDDKSLAISLFTFIYSLFMPPFLFFTFICKPSVWKMLKIKLLRLGPNCEKLASRIFSMISRRHPPTTSEEIPINLELCDRPTLQNRNE